MIVEFDLTGPARNWRRRSLKRAAGTILLAGFVLGGALLYAGPIHRAGSTALSGDCQGSISASPTSGHVGDSVTVEIRIKPPFNRMITSVRTDNPRCHMCKADFVGPGRFVQNLVVVGDTFSTFTWKVRFLAYDGEGRERCSGDSAELTVLAR